MSIISIPPQDDDTPERIGFRAMIASYLGVPATRIRNFALFFELTTEDGDLSLAHVTNAPPWGVEGMISRYGR